MRITGGELGGRRIPPPPRQDIRPTPDAVREALFHLLPCLEGKNFLDLYAGTGMVGIEALSRGAEKAVFVERQAVTGRKLRELLIAWGLKERSRVMIMEAGKGMKILAGEERKFQVVFADPPYERALIDHTVDMCCRAGILAEDGVFVLQRSIREPITPAGNRRGMIIREERRYGDTVLTFLEHAMKE